MAEDITLQSKFSWTKEYMGPTIGWVSRPANNDRIVTGSTAVTRYDRTLVMKVSGAATITLPTVQDWLLAGLGGNPLLIKDGLGNAGTYALTLQTTGGNTIDGASTKVINTAWGSITIQPSSDLSSWLVDVALSGGSAITSISMATGSTGIVVNPTNLSANGTFTFSWNVSTAWTALGLGTAAGLAVGDITKSLVGLGNCDNTADANKPVSAPQAAALALKSNVLRTLSVVGTTTYTLALSDSGKVLFVSGSSGCTITVPNDATVAWAGITQIDIFNYNTGTVAVTAGSGVTIRSESGKLKINATYQAATLLRIAANEWAFFGAIKA